MTSDAEMRRRSAWLEARGILWSVRALEVLKEPLHFVPPLTG